MSPNVLTLHKIEKVKVIKNLLEKCQHSSFPIIDNSDDTFDGLITRNVLVTLVNNAIWFNCQDTTVEYGGIMDQVQRNSVPTELLSHQEFTRNQENKVLKLNQDLEQVDDNAWIDLRQYIDRGGINMNMLAPVQKILKLFKNIGVRHLVVTNQRNLVKGIITRKDLILYNKRF